MSVVRRSDNSDIYIYSIKDGLFVCDRGTNNHDKEVMLNSKTAVLLHALWHKCKGDKVPMKKVIQGLKDDT